MADQRRGPHQRHEIIGKKGRWQIRHINPYSDGEKRHWPGKPLYRPASEERYLISLGNKWASQDGLSMAGCQYYLDKLPDGYGMFETDQPGGPQTYKRLFGHPSGRYYDSSVRFEVHFLWLMGGMQGQCDCVLCRTGKPKPFVPRPRGRPPGQVVWVDEKKQGVQGMHSETSSTSESAPASRGTALSTSRPQRQIRSAGAAYAQDAEGTEDIWKDCIKRLEANRDSKNGIEIDIREINSIDWRAEHKCDNLGSDILARTLTTIAHQHSFVPRVGELVLWCPNFLDDHYLMLDEEKMEYKFYSFDQKCFHGFPAWRGGVVAAVPSASGSNGPIDFPDIQDLPRKRTAMNTAGFRIETFPDPNEELDKSASKQYRYVPLRNIRPLSHWKLMLRGISTERWHESIEHALACMTSVSLLEKWRFNGEWPQARILCKGVYIGSELVLVGDAVRITPQRGSASESRKCTDILLVQSIRLNLVGIKNEHTLSESPTLATKFSITLVGRAYTLDVRQHYQMRQGDATTMQTVVPSAVPLEEVKTAFRAVGSADYGSWYYLHDPAKAYEISYDQVLGRLYEAGAVQIWTGKLQKRPSPSDVRPNIKPSLDFDLRGIEEGRQFATQEDERLEEAPVGQVCWFWADTRAEALDLETLNGVEVSRYHTVRDAETLQLWQNQMKILNGQDVSKDSFRSQFTSNFGFALSGQPRGRKPGARVVDGKVVYPGQAGYEDGSAAQAQPDSSTPRKHKSQLANAALVATDDEDELNEPEDLNEKIPKGNRPNSALDLRGKAQMSIRPTKKAPLTKTQIMTSVEDSMALVDDSSDDAHWLEDPIPMARGGTEESEGGDYQPTQ
jgi:hypothetical protein